MVTIILECSIAVENLAVDNRVSLACNEDKGDMFTPVSSSEVADDEDDNVLLVGCANTTAVVFC